MGACGVAGAMVSSKTKDGSFARTIPFQAPAMVGVACKDDLP